MLRSSIFPSISVCRTRNSVGENCRFCQPVLAPDWSSPISSIFTCELGKIKVCKFAFFAKLQRGKDVTLGPDRESATGLSNPFAGYHRALSVDIYGQ